MKSEKLEVLHDSLVKMLRESYPDYRIKQYVNGLSLTSWLDVIDNYTNLRIAEVIAVENSGSYDKCSDNLLVIDYVNSNSRIFDDGYNAYLFVTSILDMASDRKKAKEQQEYQVHLESLRADEIKLGTIDPTKFYLVTGRGNGKTLFYQNLLKSLFGFKIKDVIFNNPATIVFWEDGEKTVVQCQNGEEFDPEKGLAMAISKKIYGNKHAYYDVFKKWVGKYNKKKDKTKNPREGQDFNDYLNEQLKDPEFKKQYENTEVLKPYCDTSKENTNNEQ